MNKAIIFLICKKLGVKKSQRFQFSNQRSENDWYFFSDFGLWKVNADTAEVISSRVSLNWLLSSKCKIRILADNKER